MEAGALDRLWSLCRLSTASVRDSTVLAYVPAVIRVVLPSSNIYSGVAIADGARRLTSLVNAHAAQHSAGETTGQPTNAVTLRYALLSGQLRNSILHHRNDAETTH